MHRHGRDENRHLKMADALTKARHRRRAPDADHSCPRTSIQSPGAGGRTPATARAAMPRSRKEVRQLIADSNERLSTRVSELEKAEPMQAQTSKWVTAGGGAHWPCWHLHRTAHPRAGVPMTAQSRIALTAKIGAGATALAVPLVMLYEGIGVCRATAIPSAS